MVDGVHCELCSATAAATAARKARPRTRAATAADAADAVTADAAAVADSDSDSETDWATAKDSAAAAAAAVASDRRGSINSTPLDRWVESIRQAGAGDPLVPIPWPKEAAGLGKPPRVGRAVRRWTEIRRQPPCLILQVRTQKQPLHALRARTHTHTQKKCPLQTHKTPSPQTLRGIPNHDDTQFPSVPLCSR